MANRFEILADEKRPNRFEELAKEHEVVPKTKKTMFKDLAEKEKLLDLSNPWSENYDPVAATDLSIKLKKPAIDVTPLKEAFTRGGRSGVSGLLLGYKPDEAPKDENWLEHMAALAGELISDVPGFWAGGKLGALVGGGIGSVIPGVGTAGGILGGGAAGAMAFPSLIKHSFQEYRDFVEKGNNLSFGEFLERAGRISKETGKSATVGLVTAGMSKFLPFMKKIPKFNKLLDTRPGRAVAGTALEYAGLTGGQALVEGKLPTAQQMFDNAAQLMMLKLTHGARAKTSEFFKELSKPTQKSRTKAFMKMLPKSVQESIKQRFPDIGKETQQQKFKEILRDNLGVRERKIYENQMEVKEALERAQGKSKFTSKQLEEMIYYKQKTGNPFVEGDSLEKLVKRLPKSAREFVDKDVTNHFAKMAAEWNKHPRTKNMNPREVLREIYMPGLFEYNTKQFNKAWDRVTSKFKIKNPFSKPKQFLTFLEAFREAGLKPRYDNIIDFINSYDNRIIRTISNINLLDDVAKHQKNNPEPLIVNSFDGDAYRDAKLAGYVPMDDVFLRTYKLEPSSKGQVAKKLWKTSDSPALVHPAFAEAFQGVFSKESYRAPTKLGKILEKTDQLRDIIRFTRVELSPFHYFSLLESQLGSMGFKNPRWYSEGGRLKQNKAIMKDAIEHGLKLDYRARESGQKATGLLAKGTELLSKGVEQLPENLATKGAKKSLRVIEKGTNHLFEEFHPRLKLSTYNHYVNSEIIERINKGEKLSNREVKLIKQDIADLCNNMYGGQNWEYMNFFNSKRNLTGLRRLVGYPDWTMSTIRQALDFTAPGIKGKLSRNAWKRYGVFMVGVHGGLKFFNSGWKQTDDKDKSIKGLKFDVNKALRGLMTGGPKWDNFPLPDIDVKIAGQIFNPGRDAKGKKLVGHFGKQAKEILRHFVDPISSFFSKTNPLIQMATDQIFGGTPRKGGGMWLAEPAWKYGKSVPWEGKEGLAQIPSRVKHLLKGLLPYSTSTLTDKGLAPYVGSLFGAFPVSQAITSYSATPYIEDAIREPNNARSKEKLESIRSLMKDGGIPQGAINKRINTVRNAIEEENVMDDMKSAIRSNNTKEISRLRKHLLDRGVSKQKISWIIKKARR